MRTGIRLRPSSHSDDVCIVATFKSAKTAAKAAAHLDRFITDYRNNPQKYDLDWGPNDAEVFTVENRVNFSVYTAGCLDEVNEIIASHRPTKTEDYVDYQEAEIEVTLPKALTPATMALLLPPEEVDMLKWLKSVEGPKVKNRGKTQTLTWHYAGSGVLYNNTIDMNGKPFRLDEHPNWRADLV
jgi:hypothetical protein